MTRRIGTRALARAAAVRASGERGSFTFAVIFWALMAMMLAGLVVDGGLSITERQRAGDIAEQAARAGAEQLDQALLRRGVFQIDQGAACNQVNAVGIASGLPSGAAACDGFGQTTLPSGQVVPTITVKVTITYTPILIGLVYAGNFVASTDATAHPQPGT
jgi:Flp pilus assembly protein TadG